MTIRTTTLAIAAIPLCLAALAHDAAAACTGPAKLVFSCTTTKQKVIEVCDAGKTIEYSFGKAGAKPELALAVPRSEASTFQWEGIGSAISYTVDIPNGKTVYSVFWSAEKATANIESGVNVEVDGKHVARVLCKPDTTVQNIEGIKLKRAAY